MSRYTRAKREDAVKPSKRRMQFSIGNVWNSLKDLNIMCNDKANEVIKYVELRDGEELEVVFWTEDIPELICIAKISKNEFGLPVYTLDYSQSTLI